MGGRGARLKGLEEEVEGEGSDGEVKGGRIEG